MEESESRHRGTDMIDKKKLANERRLKAVQEWQKKRSRGAVKNTRIIYENASLNSTSQVVNLLGSNDVPNPKKGQLKLFDSDDEESNFGDCFKIRPQFEGKNGLQMLEMSTELGDRFKLDERFVEEEESIHNKDDQENSEKNKNIRILESILGHEVSKKHNTDVNLKRKREIERFDPEDKGGANFVKNLEKPQKKTNKKIRKNEPLGSNEKMPYSSERYIEVSSNLKDIMNSTSTFSFSEKFKLNCNTQDITDIGGKSNITDSVFETRDLGKVEKTKAKEEISGLAEADFESSTSLKDSFFIADSDQRLKEGVEFFQRQKSEEEVRNDWLMKRNAVLDIFKRRRKSAQRGFLKKPKQNQRKQFPLRK